MDVILDTYIYYGLIYGHGSQFTAANYFVELVTYLKRTNSNLVVPTLVFDELSAKYRRDLSQQIKDARDAHESMTRNMMDDWYEFSDPDIVEQVNLLRAQVLDPAKGFKSQIVDAYKNISTGEVARRGIERIRPANAKGEELRDVMLWLFVLEHAKKGKVAFISDDSTFQGATTNLHPDLADDTKRAKVEVLYYPSLSKFITENSLTAEPATNEEMAALISFAEIGNLAEPLLAKLGTRQGKITSAKVRAANIVDAQKYRVGDDAFYIEANYAATADLILENALYINTFLNAFVTGKQSEPSAYTIPPGLVGTLGAWTPPTPPIWNSGFFFPSTKQPYFGKIGNVLSPPVSGVTYEPTVLHQSYDADLSLKFSLRLKGGEKESLQLEELEISKLTICSKPDTKVQK